MRTVIAPSRAVTTALQPDISNGVKAPIENQFLAQRCVQGSGAALR